MKCYTRYCRFIVLIILFLFSFDSSLIGQSELRLEVLIDSINAAVKKDYKKSLLLFDSYTDLCNSSSAMLCDKDSIQLIKANVLLRGAKDYKNIKLDSARLLVDQSIELYQKYNRKKLLHDALYTSGGIHFMNGTNREGILDFEKYIKYYSEHKNEYEVAKGNYKKASCYRRMGVQDSTITYLHKALPVFEKMKNWKDVANCYQVFGMVYTSLKQYEVSQNYLDKALVIFEEDDNIGGQARILTCMGNNTYSSGDTTGCIQFYKRSGQLNEAENIVEGIYVNFYNTANAYFQLAQFDSSLVYVNKANAYRDKLGKRHNYMIRYKQGSIYIEIGENQKGIDLLKEAFETALELDGYIDARDMSNYLSRGYENIGDYRLAHVYARKFAELKDSVITIESNKTINELKAKYETEKKEIQIENLELVNDQQSKMIFGGGIALALISLLSFILFRVYQKVKTQKALIAKSLKEKDLLLREIHHRVKNNLQLVSSLLTLQGRSIDDLTAQQAINEGKNRVRSMALIHQDLYNKENLVGIGVKEYLEKLTSELFQTYRVDKNRIVFSSDIQNLELDVDTMVPLGLIINELLTNSLKYAFPEDKTGKIDVGLYEEDGKLKLVIEDNGVGYDQSKVRDNSFGSTLITALTEQLEGDILTTSDKGTKTIITFNEYNVI